MSKEAKPDAWMPLYIGDWAADTAHLTCEQDGAYFRIVRHYWRKGPPADDDGALSRLTGLDLKTWRKSRPVLSAFFQVVDGAWRHKRVDEELAKWSERKLKAVERARKGGEAKAKGSASSMLQAHNKQDLSSSQAVLKGCSSSSSREVEGLTGHSTLSGQAQFLGPKEVRAAFADALGEAWTASYIDHCTWQDIPDRALIPATRFAANKIIKDGRALLHDQAISVLERAA